MNSFNETPTVTGQVTLTHKDAAGNIISESTVKNLVVTTGRNYIASRMAGTSSPVMSHMALGNSTADPTPGDTALGGSLGRVALTATSVTGNQVTYTATFAAGTATGAIVEAGIFNAASVGDMLCRTKFDVINKLAGDSLAVTWVVTVN